MAAEQDSSTSISDSKPTAALPASPVTGDDSWKLPVGIEDHIEAGLIKTAAGVAIGGAVGMVLFRAGSWRAASAAVGAGVALGSSYERIKG